MDHLFEKVNLQNQNHFLSIGVALFLLISVPLTVFLAVNTRDNRSKAAVLVRYTALGDSITSGYGLTDLSQGWVSLYRNYLNTSLGVSVGLNNLGIPSLPSSGLLNKVETDSTFRSNIANADIITIDTGFVDWWSARWSNCATAADQTCLASMLANFKTNFDTIIGQIRSQNSKSTLSIRVMNLYNPYVVADSGKPYLDYYLQQINSYISSRSGALGFQVADAHLAYNGSSGTEDPNTNGYILPDTIHPTVLGHSVIAAQFQALILPGLTTPLQFSWGRPAGYASFTDVNNKASSCFSANLNCSTPPYVYWPGSTVKYVVRVNSYTGPVLTIGTTTATSDARAVANWNWRYMAQIFPSSFSTCSQAGALCKTQMLSNSNSKVGVLFTNLPVGGYKEIVCAPDCASGMVIYQNTDSVKSSLVSQIILSGKAFCQSSAAYVSLQWTLNTDDYQFNIIKDGNAITSTLSPPFSWTTSGPEAQGQTHTWQVYGVNNGIGSNLVSFPTPTCP